MTRARITVALTLTALLIAGAVTPAAAAADQHAGAAHGSTAPALDAQSSTSSNATVGAQLSTVVAATSDEVETEFEDTAFEIEYESGDERERAGAVANRTADLVDRAGAIRAEYENVTSAYEAGEIDRQTYAQRIATLNARANNVLSSLRTVERRAAELEESDLEAAGTSTAEISAAKEDLQGVTGPGTNALFRQFTGESAGKFEIDVENGVSIEVESEDGETSREFERERTGNGSIEVSQADALATARAELSDVNGAWQPVEAKLDSSDGVYEFEFELSGEREGEAEASVDAATGQVFALEEEIEGTADDEKGEDDEKDEKEEGEDGESSLLLIVGGAPAPGAEITITALVDGEPTSGVTVEGPDDVVGTTGANGTVTTTLPAEGGTYEAEYGDADAELELEFENESDEDEAKDEKEDEDEENAEGDLDAAVSLSGEQVTVEVTYNGSAVSDASVEVNGDVVGTTDENGQIAFALPADDELEIGIERGELETEVKYGIENGTLVSDENGDEDDETDEDGEEQEDGEEDDSDGDDDSDEDGDDSDEDDDDSDGDDA